MGHSEQREVFEFLRCPHSWPGLPPTVDVIETHGALIFMAGDDVLKVKRDVRLPYLDFSTRAARERFLRREIELNAPHAPGLYRDVVAITREGDGRLAIDGPGEPVEWGLRMRRFSQDDLLSHVVTQPGVSQGGLANVWAGSLARSIVRYHAVAARPAVPVDPMDSVCTSLATVLSTCRDLRLIDYIETFNRTIAEALASSADTRLQRTRSGFIRRCHGDLHLGNIVLWQGAPVLFDALEFDETLATIDTLYDLAFLLMDLERHGARATANVVLNRYLWQTGAAMDLSGLRALPLFMGVRAGIRAMVALDRARLGAGLDREAARPIGATLELGTRLATPTSARLIAVGGLSGTGKSTLAAALAPHVGSAPGAIHIRTDLERKWLAQVDEFVRLPEDAYTEDATAAVYARTMDRARLVLAAGHSVVVDGVFALPEERQALFDLARSGNVSFCGLWLDASPSVMKERVAARVLDASDATPAVVDFQLALDTGPIEWVRIDASAERDCVLAFAFDQVRSAPAAT